MKRSEILNILDSEYAKFVEDFLEADLDNLEGLTPLNERLLQAIEKAGMLPPLRDMNDSDELSDSAIVADLEGYTLKVAKWESEN
jgi:hypothetical protein